MCVCMCLHMRADILCVIENSVCTEKLCGEYNSVYIIYTMKIEYMYVGRYREGIFVCLNLVFRRASTSTVQFSFGFIAARV